MFSSFLERNAGHESDREESCRSSGGTSLTFAPYEGRMIRSKVLILSKILDLGLDLDLDIIYSNCSLYPLCYMLFRSSDMI